MTPPGVGSAAAPDGDRVRHRTAGASGNVAVNVPAVAAVAAVVAVVAVVAVHRGA